MKKIVLFCLVCAMAVPAVAQFVYAQGQSYGSSSHGIIRENSIAYYEANNIGYFAHVPPSFAISGHRVKIPEGWSIKDFHVKNNTAYFCGTDRSSGTALLGHFDISNLVSGGSTVTFYRNNLGCNSLSILNRIAVYNDKNYLSLMAIGSELPGVDPTLYGADAVLYAADYSKGSFCIYRNLEYGEVFWDVVSTEQYISLVGSKTLPSSMFTLHCVPAGMDICASPEAIRMYRVFPSTLDISSGIHAAALNADTIALASYFRNSTQRGLQVFTVHAPTAYMAFNQRYTVPATSSPCPTLAPRDLAYLSDSNALMVVDTSFGNHPAVLRVNPYPTAYPFYCAPYFFKDNDTVLYTSIACVAPGMLMAACKALWTRFELGLLPPPAYSNSCIGSFDADIFIYSGYESIQAEYGSTTLCPAVLDSVLGFVEGEQFFNKCRASQQLTHIIRKNSTENNNQ